MRIIKNQDSQNESRTLKDYKSLVQLHIISLLVFSSLGLLLGILYVMFAPNIYKSTTLIKVSKPSGNVLKAPMFPEVQDFGSDRFVADEIEVMKSYRVREKVANALIDTFSLNKNRYTFSVIMKKEGDLNSYYVPKTVHEISSSLASVVSIDQKRGLDVVEISAESQSPEEAALIVNEYAKAYKSINLDYNRELLNALKNFLAQQSDEKLSQLSNVEVELKNFKEQKGIVELDEQAKSLIKQASDMDAQLNSNKIDLTVSGKTLSQLKEELKKRNPDVSSYIENFSTEPYIKRLQEQIADLKTQRDRALTSDLANSQKLVKDFDSKIAELTSRLNSQLSNYKAGILASSPAEIKDLANKVFEEEVKYQSLLASTQKMNQIVAGYDRKMNQLPSNAVDLARLQRQRDANEKLFNTVEEKYQETIINEQSTPGNVLIIDAGRINSNPVKPNRPLIVIVGLFLGIGLGIGFAFVKEYLDNKVKTPEDIQSMNINVVAWIPKIEEVKKDDKTFEFIVARKPNASASEAYRALRTRIKFFKVDTDKGALNTLLVTSATAGEGKTTTALNLAASLAQSNSKTLLFDADLRKPRVHSALQQKRYPGFTDFLFNQVSLDEVIRKSEVDNLDFIACGTIPTNPSETVGSKQMLELLEKLKNQYDKIIIDSPPIISVTDAEIISRIVDGTILVASADFTELELLEKAVELLRNDGSPFIGVVLNNFTYRSGYGSYYKYFHYYSHPSNGSDKKRIKV